MYIYLYLKSCVWRIELDENASESGKNLKTGSPAFN